MDERRTLVSAYTDIQEYLRDEEIVEAIVFGKYGWSGYDEPDIPPVPVDKRGVILSISEAEPFMQDWSFYGGYGAPDCYAVYIWTNLRVIWVTQYDGSTELDSAPRNPQNIMPDMPGG